MVIEINSKKHVLHFSLWALSKFCKKKEIDFKDVEKLFNENKDLTVERLDSILLLIKYFIDAGLPKAKQLSRRPDYRYGEYATTAQEKPSDTELVDYISENDVVEKFSVKIENNKFTVTM